MVSVLLPGFTTEKQMITVTQFFTAALVTMPKSRNNPNLPPQMNIYTKGGVFIHWTVISHKEKCSNDTHHSEDKNSLKYKKPTMKVTYCYDSTSMNYPA